MDKALAGLLGAVGALAVATPGQAAPMGAPNLDEVMRAESYADLLKPIPNAAAVLQVSDEAARAEAARSEAARPEAEVLEVQYYYHHHHHHHHHHGYYRPRYARPFFAPRFAHHHHHHHHHHHGPAIIIR